MKKNFNHNLTLLYGLACHKPVVGTSVQCAEDRRFKSCQGLRFFFCPMLVSFESKESLNSVPHPPVTRGEKHFSDATSRRKSNKLHHNLFWQKQKYKVEMKMPSIWARTGTKRKGHESPQLCFHHLSHAIYNWSLFIK